MKLGVIGVGNMASAILESVFENDVFSPSDIALFDPYSKMVEIFKNRGCLVAASVDELLNCSNIILLAIKPNNIEDALSNLSVDTCGKCFISIAAGISSDYLKKFLSKGTYVIRVMPNTPIMVNCGASAIAMSEDVPVEYYNRAVSIFSSAGSVSFVKESLINAVTAVNGSGPAYFFTMADEMVKTAEEQGIDRETALFLTAKTMEGAARMLLESGRSPSELADAVSSPGGTTLAALNEMKNSGFYNALKKGMLACIERANEIGK